MRDALVQIVLRLRDDALKDKEGSRNLPTADSIYRGSGGLSLPSVLPSVSQVSSLGFDQRVENGSGLGMLSSSNNLFAYGSLPVCLMLLSSQRVLFISSLSMILCSYHGGVSNLR